MAIIITSSSSTTLGVEEAASVTSSSSSSSTSSGSGKKGSDIGLIVGIVIAVVVVFVAVVAFFLWRRRRGVVSARHVSVKKLEEFNIDSDKPTALSPSKKISTTSLRSDASKQISPWTNDNMTGSSSRSTLDVTYRSGGESGARHLLPSRTPTSSTAVGSRSRLTLDIPDRMSFASSSRSRERRKDHSSDHEHSYCESDDPHAHGLYQLQSRHAHRHNTPHHHHHHHHHRHESRLHTVRTSDGRIRTVRLPPLRPKSRPSSSAHDDQTHPHQDPRRRRKKRDARTSRIFRAVFFAKAGSSNSGSAYAPSTVLTSEISERPTTNLSPVPEAPPPLPPSRSHSPQPPPPQRMLQIANPEDI